jgi:5-methyltetrahydropteroyltriglutamate--homocysteine methyltransferase
MNRSSERILLSHTGGLHRPQDLRQMIAGHPESEPFDAALDARVAEAISEVVRLQVETGVDVVNDGEFSKRSWSAYIRGRLGGVEQREARPGERNVGGITARESRVFPEYFASLRAGAMASSAAGGAVRMGPVTCVGPLTYTGMDETQRDIRYLTKALAGSGVSEAFLSAISPGSVEHYVRNEHYKTDEEFLYRIAEIMRDEYKAITDAGFILQLDDPGLPDGYGIHADMSVAEYRKYAQVRVEATNYALRDCPEEQVRLHICWGSVHHPHTQDIPLADIIDLLYEVNAQCYSIEQANPMHEHEWTAFKDHPLPDGKIIMPGVIGHCAPEFVEHPEAVAQRLLRYAELVGRENVIAGTDCGLARAAHESIQWAKFRAGAEGARIASKQLWG